MRILERARRAGCVATGVAMFALFFAVGFLVSLFSGDFLTTLQALAVAALLGGAALWLERRHRRTARAEPRHVPPPVTPPRPPSSRSPSSRAGRR